MSIDYHQGVGLFVTFPGLTIAVPESMTVTAIANYINELEAFYG